MKKIIMKIKGMHCPSCEILLKDEFEEIGVKSASIDHKKGRAIIEFDESKIKIEQLKKIVTAEDYSVLSVTEV